MKKALLLVLAMTSMSTFAQPSNDTCATSTNIAVVTANTNQYTAEVSTAAETQEGACQNAAQNNPDVWFNFIMPEDGNIRITNIGGSDNATLYDACAGTELACFFNDGFVYGLSSGSTYTLKMSKQGSPPGDFTFNIQAFEVIPNNVCATPEVIVVDTLDFLEVTTESRGATESSDSSCENASNINLDSWFEFVMPVDGNIRITAAGGSDNFSLYSDCVGTEIDCFYNDGFIFNLSAGLTYKLRHGISGGLADSDSFRIQAFETIVNDDCDNAESILVEAANPLEVFQDARAATESTDSSCETASNTNLDLWYKFTMPVDGNLRITAAGGFDNFSLYTDCVGTEIACFFNDGFAFGLTSGTEYKLRFATLAGFADADSFVIQAFETIMNDDCDNAESIVVETANPLTVSQDSRAATESTDSSCETASNTNLDLWYEFTMPVNGNVRITAAGGFDNFSLYTDCLGAEVACFYDDGFVYNLTSGTEFKLRFATLAGFADADSFTIQAFETIMNDDCDNAESIVVETANPLTVSQDSRAATESTDSSCENATNTNLDLWYTFTMPVDGNIRITAAGGFDNFSLYTDCIGTEIACFFDDNFIYSLTGGLEYKLRFATIAAFADADSFVIQAFETIANNECDNSENILVSTDNFIDVAVESRGATESTDSSCENTGDINLDAWYDFTMPVNGNIRITQVGGFDNLSLYTDCLGTEIACRYDDGFFYDLVEGVNYKLRFASIQVFADGDTFRIQAFETIENNDCSTPELISIPTVSPTTYFVELRGATESIDGDCENVGDFNHDAWYEFIMPIDGNLQVTQLGGFDTVSLYDSCGSVAIDCQFDDSTFSNLTGGETYFLRIGLIPIFVNEIDFRVLAVPSPLSPCLATVEYIGGNWVPNEPDSATNAVIKDHYDTSTEGSFTACSVVIELNNNLTVAAGDYINVTYGITVDGILNVAHQGSVVQQDGSAVTTNNGTINVQVTTPDLAARDFMLAGSPMSMETREGVYADAIRVFAHNTLNFEPNAAVALAFPMAVNFADDNGDNFSQHTGVLNPGEGYLVKPQLTFNEPTQSYMHTFSQGTLNNGDYNFTVVFGDNQNDSPNQLANPYPSPILADDFINANAMINEVYFWEHLTPASAALPGYNSLNFSMEDISMYNLMGGVKASSDVSPGEDTKPNGIIATSQGFGIKANASGTAVFSNNMRRLTGNTTLRTAEEELNKIWVAIETPEYDLKSNTLIGFSENATAQVDAGYDSNRLASILSIFSGIDGSDVELGIQGRELFNEDMTIPFGFSSQIDANILYRISLDDIEGNKLNEATVYVFDHLIGVKINLSKSDYEFTSEKGQFPNRFTLFFTNRVLGIASETFTEFTIAPNPGTGIFTVSSQNQNITDISVYDYLGRIVAVKKDLNISEKTIDISSNASGVYFIKVKTNHGALTNRYIKK